MLRRVVLLLALPHRKSDGGELAGDRQLRQVRLGARSEQPLVVLIHGPNGPAAWPPEIDIFEFFGSSTSPEAHLHTTGGDINKGFNDSNGSTDLSLAFHTYALDLSTSELAFYLDGAQQWSYTNTGEIANLFAAGPLYVLLNMQLGGAAGSPTGAVPADMVIDYVRTWQ
jgi:beta-glucanase (GH16 family)